MSKIDIEVLKSLVGQIPDEGGRLSASASLAAVEGDIDRKQSLLKTIQESIQTIRMDVKYLLLDLEATRRERDDAVERLNNVQ